MLPEVEATETSGELQVEIPRTTANVLDAIAAGATDGIKLAVNVGGMLLVSLALTALANAVFGWLGTHLFGLELTLERLFGWVFSPLAWLLGVPAADVTLSGDARRDARHEPGCLRRGSTLVSAASFFGCNRWI